MHESGLIGALKMLGGGPRKHLFQRGAFRLHSGATSTWKIECDALTPLDWATLAEAASHLVLPFEVVDAVPGAEAFAEALRPYAVTLPKLYGPSPFRLLIVDDVLTTSGSMEAHRAGRPAQGIVAFARNKPLPWIRAVFTYGGLV